MRAVAIALVVGLAALTALLAPTLAGWRGFDGGRRGDWLFRAAVLVVLAVGVTAFYVIAHVYGR